MLYLSQKSFVLTEARTNSPAFRLKCHEPSVMPLSYPGTPEVEIIEDVSIEQVSLIEKGSIMSK